MAAYPVHRMICFDDEGRLECVCRLRARDEKAWAES